MSSAQPILMLIGVCLIGAVISQDDYCFRNSCNKMEPANSRVKAKHNRIREEFLSSGNTPKVPHVSRKLTNTCCSNKMPTTTSAGKMSTKTHTQKQSQTRNRNPNTLLKIRGSKKKRKKLKRKKARQKYKEYRNKRLKKREKRPAR